MIFLIIHLDPNVPNLNAGIPTLPRIPVAIACPILAGGKLDRRSEIQDFSSTQYCTFTFCTKMATSCFQYFLLNIYFLCHYLKKNQLSLKLKKFLRKLICYNTYKVLSNICVFSFIDTLTMQWH